MYRTPEYVDPDLRELFKLAKMHNAIFIWDGMPDNDDLNDTDMTEFHSVDMDRLLTAVGEEEVGRYHHLLGGKMTRLPVLGRNFWAPAGHYQGLVGGE